MQYDNTAGRYGYGIALGLRAWNDEKVVCQLWIITRATNSISGVLGGKRLNTPFIRLRNSNLDLYDKYMHLAASATCMPWLRWCA